MQHVDLSLLLCLFLSPFIETIKQNATEAHRVKRNVVCYDRVGCFADGPPFSSQASTVFLPESPDDILTTYLMYTRNNVGEEEKLDARRPGNFTRLWPQYSPKRLTKIILHGGLPGDTARYWEKLVYSP